LTLISIQGLIFEQVFKRLRIGTEKKACYRGINFGINHPA
jgi:hypothetical protein